MQENLDFFLSGVPFCLRRLIYDDALSSIFGGWKCGPVREQSSHPCVISIMLFASLAACFLLQTDPEFDTITMTIRGEERRAIIVRPSQGAAPHPVIFGFHGHGGNGRNAARSFNLHEEWPEAIAVYPFGLPTATGRDPEGLKPGWGYGPENRDVAFFDSLLEQVIAKEKGDGGRVFVMGHSNGGGFVYGLWRWRGDKLAGVAPSAAAGARPPFEVRPKPAFMMMGQQDAVVPFESQKASLINVLKVNLNSDLSAPPKPDYERSLRGSTVRGWKGKERTGVFEHPGGHQFPAQAVKIMVQFFKNPQLPPS